jgi:hypothetical protein
MAHLPAHLFDLAEGQWQDIKEVQELLRRANGEDDA